MDVSLTFNFRWIDVVLNLGDSSTSFIVCKHSIAMRSHDAENVC